MSRIVHNTDFESDIYDSSFESNDDYDREHEDHNENQRDQIDFLGVDGNFSELENTESDLYITNLVHNIENRYNIVLNLENIQSLSMNQVLDILLDLLE